jgi:hypothetical protein
VPRHEDILDQTVSLHGPRPWMRPHMSALE